MELKKKSYLRSVALLALGKHYFAECLKRTLGKSSTLLSAYRGHSANRALYQWSDVVHTIKSDTVSPTHGQHIGAVHVHLFCRVWAPRHSAKAYYITTCAFSLRSAGTRQTLDMQCAKLSPSSLCLALGNGPLCRVPVDWHSAKARAHGKVQFSGSKPHPLIGKLTDRVHEIYTVSFCLFSATT